MADGMLSLAWNNHSSTFSHMLTTLREMEKYTDATVACEGKFYGVHKLVLATCSDYFFKMFEQTPCKHPVVVLKDIGIKEIEALLSYMYDGVVSVAQSDLSKLISAAEILQIKGLAVPDEPPKPRKKVPHSQSTDDSGSPQPKRPRRETASSSNNSYSDKSSHRRSERIESKDSGNRKDNKEETVVLDQSDPVQESNDNEVQADEPEIETIDDDSDIKEEVSIENDDIQVNDFVLSPVTQDATVESNNIIKDLGNLEATVGFTSPTEQLFESQAWGNAQELSNQGFSMDAASLAGPSGSQPQQEQHLKIVAVTSISSTPSAHETFSSSSQDSMGEGSVPNAPSALNSSDSTNKLHAISAKEISPDVSVLNTSSAPHSTDKSLDVSEEQPSLKKEESQEKSLSESVEPSQTEVGEVTFEVVSEGTLRAKQKLVSSNGFTFTLKRKSLSSKEWRCSVRNKTINCRSVVIEHNDGSFEPRGTHNHKGKPGILTSIKIYKELRDSAKKGVSVPTAVLVDQILREHADKGDPEAARPKYMNLVRNYSRIRQKQKLRTDGSQDQGPVAKETE